MNTEGIVIWFTGLPACGKTTLARRVAEAVANRVPILLDSDEVRDTLDLVSYERGDRDAFYHLLGGLAALLARQGHVVLVAATAPRRAHRAHARSLAPRFLEVHVATPRDVCEARDPKGLYRRARAGELPDLPGVGVDYESPRAAEIVVVPGHEAAAIAEVTARLT